MVSIIIVHYKVKKELIDCISSILESKPKVKFEIIVVDNDKKNEISKDLLSQFPKVQYVKSPKNLGYGGGNNLGAHHAQGEYLFFLNPDTKILDKALDNLYNFIINNRNVGIVSPIFLNSDLKPFKSQGSRELTPRNIIFSQSFLRKIFPSKNILNEASGNSREAREVETVPGGAMMISSSLFKKIGGFDERFFLYFEENDISKRVSKLGKKLFIIPSAKIIHLVGKSTKYLENMENVFSKSRYFYLRKHYGLFNALFLRAILSLNKYSILLVVILISGFFLRIMNIQETMQFIGDQGWFYLSARDMIVNGAIPLVGIASSHPWLHQGPLWTYMLAGDFWLFGFNPLNGAYLTIVLGTLSVLLIYIIGSEMFSKRIGLIAAFLYTTSPLAVTYSRVPYHTSPIPLFTLFYILSLYKWIKGDNIFFPVSILFLAILYNFELATSILWFVMLAILFYGILKRKDWVKKLLNKKILIYSALAFAIPMLPVLIYDSNHNFPQTLGFIAWIGYRILRFFGFPSIHGEDQLSGSNSMIIFPFAFYQNLIFVANYVIALIILIFTFIILVKDAIGLLREKIYSVGFALLTVWMLISFVGYFINQTSSEAYLPIFFPAIIYLTAYSFDKIMKTKLSFIPVILLIVFIGFINGYFVILSDYSTKGLIFSKRLSVAKEIVRTAKNKDYNLIGAGNGSEFASFTMNYEYLTWWLGHSPSKSLQKLKFIVSENTNGISLIKNE